MTMHNEESPDELETEPIEGVLSLEEVRDMVEAELGDVSLGDLVMPERSEEE